MIWVILGIVVAFVLSLKTSQAAGRQREIHRLARIIAERDREIANLRNRLQESQSRLEAIRSRLGQLEQLLQLIDEQQNRVAGSLKLDSQARLLEER